MLKQNRVARACWSAPVIAWALLIVPGCDTMLPALVGKPRGGQGSAVSVPAPPPSASFASAGAHVEGVWGGAHTVLPPTLAADDAKPEDSDAAGPAGAGGPHAPIVTMPITSDPVMLSGLGAAANRSGGPAARFVVLILTPPAADPASLDRENLASRAAADAAGKAMGAAGIAADRIEISSATNAAVGTGEIRLYAR